MFRKSADNGVIGSIQQPDPHLNKQKTSISKLCICKKKYICEN